MGDMKDQYDDGRYDGVTIVLPGGWHVPPHMAPEPFASPAERSPIPGLHPRYGLPITAPRGGIKYPTPAKLLGVTMAQSMTQKLAALQEQQLGLARQIAALEKAIKRPAPPAEQNAWTIDVRFNRDGKLYNYLILRVNGMFYTTGSGDTAFFRTWSDLLIWLDSLAGHSAMIPLRTDYEMTAPLEGRQS